MKIIKIVVASSNLLLSQGVYAENIVDMANSIISPLAISGYVESYYSVDLSKSANDRKSPLFVNHNRDEELAVNLAFLKTKYDTENIKANLALAVGTYMRANYAAEPSLLKNLYEGSVAVRISKEKNIWVETGVFSSHLGFESAKGENNWTLTRSIANENSPYFESGARVNYTSHNKKWFMSALVLSGWQRITPVSGNTLPSFGTQITYSPSSKVTLNSSTFIGTDTPDRTRLMRYFHNFFAVFNLNNNFAATFGIDVGIEQKNKGSSSYNTWFNPTAVLRYSPTSNTAIAVRGEYYDDNNSVIVSSVSSNGFKTWSFSANFDWRITKNFLWRIEARSLVSKDSIFIRQNGATSNNNTFLTTALAVSF